MDSLASIFFAPGAAASVANTAKSAASAIARPFAEVLSALTAPQESAAESSATSDNVDAIDGASSLEDRIAEMLQEILESVGAVSGDQATVTYDPETDEAQVITPASWGDDASIDVSTNGDLMDALRALAASNETSKPLELLVEVG